MFRNIIFLISTLLLTTVWAGSSTGSRVLIVLEPRLERSQFEKFFGGLEGRGYNLKFREPKQTDSELQLITDDVPNFDHLIFFTPRTKSFAPDITPQALVTLLSHNVNIIFALSSTQTPFHTLASEFGLVFPPPNTPLISHFDSAGPDARDTIALDLPRKNPLFPGSSAKVLYRGVSHSFMPNSGIFPILNAPAESFASDSEVKNDKGNGAIADGAEKGGEGLWAGSSMGVVSGFVTKNGARVLWCGGVDLFSDEFTKPLHGFQFVNSLLVQDLAGWTFQENLVLRIANVSHHLESPTASIINPPPPQESYVINDRITYTVGLETWSSGANAWIPFSVPAGDKVQLEYTMLDPFIRTDLASVEGHPGYYTTTFRAPDRHGVFKLALTYFRKGYTPLKSEVKTPLVPPRHDGYPRFLSDAWPYYAGAVSTSVGFVLFSALWLGGPVAKELDKGKKKRE